jgi:hypothetical protein
MKRTGCGLTGPVFVNSASQAQTVLGASSRNEPDATLSLGAGTYYVASLGLERDAKIALSDSTGKTIVYVASVLHYRGSVASATGRDPQLMLGYLGTRPVKLASAFRGTLLAPNAKLILGSDTAYRGVFLARDIEVESDVSVEFVPLSTPP